MVCTDSQIEPAPQEINGEVLTPGRNRAADARLHIHARGGSCKASRGSRGGARGASPLLIFRPKCGPKGLKKLFWRPPPPPPPLSEGLYPPLKALPFSTLGFVTRMQSLIKASPQNKSNASMRVRRRECMPEG